MKIRSGFVSNSSSASFILTMGNLTNEQVVAVEEKLGKSRNLIPKNLAICGQFVESYVVYDVKCYNDRWICSKGPGEIRGDTWMDNGDLRKWFKKLGIPKQEYVFLSDDEYEDYDEN